MPIIRMTLESKFREAREERLRALADPDDDDGDGISGRINRVWDVVTGADALGCSAFQPKRPTASVQFESTQKMFLATARNDIVIGELPLRLSRGFLAECSRSACFLTSWLVSI